MPYQMIQILGYQAFIANVVELQIGQNIVHGILIQCKASSIVPTSKSERIFRFDTTDQDKILKCFEDHVSTRQRH